MKRKSIEKNQKYILNNEKGQIFLERYFCVPVPAGFVIGRTGNFLSSINVEFVYGLRREV